MQAGCWDPIPLEDPIPITSIRSFLHSKGPKMLGIVMKDYKKGVFSLGKGNLDIRIIILHEFKAKDVITTMIREKRNVGFVVDPIFTAFGTMLVPDFERMEMVSVSLTPHETKPTLFDGYARLPNPRMLGMGQQELRFYRVNFSYWQPIGLIREDEINTTEKGANTTYVASEEMQRRKYEAEVPCCSFGSGNIKLKYEPLPKRCLSRSPVFVGRSPTSSPCGPKKTKSPSFS